jgi:hypothetical protein
VHFSRQLDGKYDLGGRNYKRGLQYQVPSTDCESRHKLVSAGFWDVMPRKLVDKVPEDPGASIFSVSSMKLETVAFALPWDKPGTCPRFKTSAEKMKYSKYQ